MIQYSIHNLWSHYSNLLQHYRVFTRERIEVGFLNPSVFGLFLMFWAFFDHSILAIFHSGTFRAYMIEKKFKNLILKKIKILGLAQIDLISAAWILGVANFVFNYLRHFFIGCENSPEFFFLKFLKLPQFGWNFSTFLLIICPKRSRMKIGKKWKNKHQEK